MARRLRRAKRLVYLGAIAGGGYAIWRATSQGGSTPHVGPPATWPPLEVGEPPVAALGDLATAEPAPAPTWVPAVDGACPADHPVKVGSSGIYHVPGGRFYDRTRPERCYVDPAAAEADGYRAAKGT